MIRNVVNAHMFLGVSFLYFLNETPYSSYKFCLDGTRVDCELSYCDFFPINHRLKKIIVSSFLIKLISICMTRHVTPKFLQ